MLTRLIDWVAGREPVATATGIATVVTAAAGLLTAFDVLDLSAEQIAAIGALVAALAGWAARGRVTPVTTPELRRLDREASPPPAPRGSIPLAMIILVVVIFLILGGVFASCDALFTDEDEPGDLGQARTELASHEYDGGYGECDPSWDDCSSDSYNYDYSSRDRNRNRGRDRGAFSPGPFRDSPVTIWFCPQPNSCNQDGRGEPPPEER